MKKGWLPFLRSLSLLFVSYLLASCAQQCFQSVEEITDRPVKGEWQDDHNYSHKMQRIPTNCPVSSLYLCHDLEKDRKESHRYFQHSDCELKEFDPLNFLSTFRNRKLVMLGDSITAQSWIMIACSIHGITPAEYNITYEFSKHHALDEAKVFYKEYNFTFVFLLTLIKYHQREGIVGRRHFPEEDCNNLEDFLTYSNVSSPFDVVVMNIGLHQVHASTFLPTVKKYAEQYNLMNPLTRPIFFWRETTPQHFDWRDEDVPMGYHITLTKDPVCYEYSNYSLAYSQDFRNRLAEIMMRKYHIPIMRVYNATRTEANSHIGLSAGGGKYTDCSHYCQESGVFYYMRDLLYNIVPVLVKHREEEIEELKKKGLREESFESKKKKFAISTSHS